MGSRVENFSVLRININRNTRKTFLDLSVPLWVRESGGNISSSSVGRGCGDHAIIPSAHLVPSPAPGTGDIGNQPVSSVGLSTRQVHGYTVALTNTVQGVTGKAVWVLGDSS